MARTDKSDRKSRRSKSTSNVDTKQKAKSWAKEWFDALLWAAVAALIIRTFFFEAYRIPTPSMERTLMTGDFLIVSKVNVGARTPMTIGIPFTSIHIKGLTLPWVRLPGWSDVERNDIVVFNYPIDDVAIAQKTNYIKRAVAIPGDTLEIRNKILYINGERADYKEHFEQLYTVKMRERLRLSEAKVRVAGGDILGAETPTSYVVNMTADVREVISTWPEIESVVPRIRPESSNEYARNNFTFRRGMSGNPDFIEPMVIPAKGMIMELTPENWPIYRDVVVRYEENDVVVGDSTFTINGVETSTYLVQKDYYFMMGDNRDNSEDSRHWGFVPDDHVVGKPFIVYFSWDMENKMPRFGRLFSFVE
ncbi:MAG TPA: signal peptidase I [Bacteroidetes bacterium]|nr:signal peptidase I [Bacteroidota bacterium]